MKSIRFTMLSSLALALLGPCFGTGLANAQGLTGKFTLPFEARWGTAALRPGDYSFKLEHAPGGSLYLYRGTKPVAIVYAQSFDQKASGHDALMVVRENAPATIREIVSGVDKRQLALALRGANEDLRAQIFKAMSSRAVEMLKEDMEVLGPVRSREVAQAQQEILNLARRLEAEGKVILKLETGDEMMA